MWSIKNITLTLHSKNGIIGSKLIRPAMKSVDATINEKEQRAHELRVALAQVEADLKVLYRARELVGGEAAIENVLPRPRQSIPDVVELILRESGALHMDEIVRRLREAGEEYAHVNKQTVVSALTRYHNKEKRFIRVGKNTYAVREGLKEGK